MPSSGEEPQQTLAATPARAASSATGPPFSTGWPVSATPPERRSAVRFYLGFRVSVLVSNSTSRFLAVPESSGTPRRMPASCHGESLVCTNLATASEELVVNGGGRFANAVLTGRWPISSPMEGASVIEMPLATKHGGRRHRLRSLSATDAPHPFLGVVGEACNNQAPFSTHWAVSGTGPVQNRRVSGTQEQQSRRRCDHRFKSRDGAPSCGGRAEQPGWSSYLLSQRPGSSGDAPTALEHPRDPRQYGRPARPLFNGLVRF